ncbi:glucoamylase, partial [Phenoliferia sp. Uapishka_3]
MSTTAKTNGIKPTNGITPAPVAKPNPNANLTLDEWIKWQEKKSWSGLLANIHPEGTVEGCVVASPSKVLPDYWYQWTRDSALVMRTVVDAFIKGEKSYRHLIDEYISATQIMQHKETPIGGFSTGGLGEVKFHVDNEPFTGEWSRPQNDGPASRVITLTKFAHYLLDNGTPAEKEFVETTLYDSKETTDSIIKGDLEHIAKDWSVAGFDLWEEVSGSHFYTLLSIYTGLLSGASLASRLSDPSSATKYLATASQIKPLITRFWSPEKSIIRVTMNPSVGRKSVENAHVGDPWYGKTSELDSAVLLATLHAGGRDCYEKDKVYGQDQVLSTLEALMNAMRDTYPLNKKRAIPALGRYPEDMYDGTGLSLAHPWFLCTCSAAEVLYLNARTLSSDSTPLIITKSSLSHYSRWVPGAKVGTKIEAGSEEMKKIVEGQRELADGFIGVVREYAGAEGNLPEQFDRWSYAAFITAVQARRGD